MKFRVLITTISPTGYVMDAHVENVIADAYRVDSGVLTFYTRELNTWVDLRTPVKTFAAGRWLEVEPAT